MKSSPVVHGSFTIERTFRAPVARVFAAWADIETKAQWFIGPPERWTLSKRAVDFRVGGEEVLQGQLQGGPTTHFAARYHAIIPNERLVYVYDMYVGDEHFSVSLATVELSPLPDGGCRMTFTEQAAFFNGQDGTESRRSGTDAHFDRLVAVLDEGPEIVSTRVIPASAERLFAAFAQPNEVVLWWGPAGFRSTLQELDLRPGGAWKFVMHGPDGASYPNEKRFLEVVRPERVVFEHLDPKHHFTMTIALAAEGTSTRVTWRLRFDSKDEAQALQAVIAEANEQNFDRLEAHVAAGG